MFGLQEHSCTRFCQLGYLNKQPADISYSQSFGKSLGLTYRQLNRKDERKQNTIKQWGGRRETDLCYFDTINKHTGNAIVE